jgi:hypothetical protein
MNLLSYLKEKASKGVLVLILYCGMSQYANAQDFYTTTPIPKSARPDLETLRGTLLSSDINPDYVMLALHRAAWVDGTPENSLAAVQRALRNPAVDIIEIDLKTSKDGKVYLMHDNYLQRTTNFLDMHPRIYGTGKDNYGKASEYSWAELSKLRLKNEEKAYTMEKIPLLEDIIEAVRDKGVILQLDINDEDTFQEAMKVVQHAHAFSFVMFKGDKTPKELEPYLEFLLTEEEKLKFIFAPFIRANSKPDGATSADPMGFYQEWEDWRVNSCLYCIGIAGLYEMVFKTPADTDLFAVAERIRKEGKRVGIFSAQPEYYRGRYFGNVNVNQCCYDNPENDRRGDFDFILAPNNNRKAGINGYIITDEVTTFLEYFPHRVIH